MSRYFVIVVVIILNSKFRFFFFCNFFNKIFANVLLFVRAIHFAWTASCYLFPTTIASSLFSGDAFKKHVNKQKISIGRCLANVSISPDLKIIFIDSNAFSRVSALHGKFFPKDVNMMSANSCLELNFIIQLIRYCHYSRHL